MAPCTACGAELETPIGCSACGALQEIPEGTSPFALFGLERRAALDTADLKRRLRRFSRLTHPDFFATQAPELLALAERNSARLNDDYELLADEVKRCDLIVRELGGPSETDVREMPQAFLMEVLEWNEAIEDAQGAAADSPQMQALEGVAGELTQERDSTLHNLERALDGGPDADALTQARQSLNAVRYIDKTLAQIRALRLAQSNAS